MRCTFRMHTALQGRCGTSATTQRVTNKGRIANGRRFEKRLRGVKHVCTSFSNKQPDKLHATVLRTVRTCSVL